MAIYCDTGAFLPVIEQSYCNPTAQKARINQIAYTVRGKGFNTDTPASTDWNDRYSNNEPIPTSANPTNEEYPIRVLNVKASKAITTYIESEISLGRKTREAEETTIEFETEDMPVSLYEVHRQLQARSFNPITAWYFTEGLEFGGKGVAATIQTDVVISDNDKEKIKLKGKITWKGGDPIARVIPTDLDFIVE